MCLGADELRAIASFEHSRGRTGQERYTDDSLPVLPLPTSKLATRQLPILCTHTYVCAYKVLYSSSENRVRVHALRVIMYAHYRIDEQTNLFFLI